MSVALFNHGVIPTTFNNNIELSNPVIERHLMSLNCDVSVYTTYVSNMRQTKVQTGKEGQNYFKT